MSDHSRLAGHLAAFDKLPPGESLASVGRAFEAALSELERLTVGRATLEDQTNRAELAEARVDALQTALQGLLEDRLPLVDGLIPPGDYRVGRYEIHVPPVPEGRTPRRGGHGTGAVLSGGSE